MRRVQPSPVEAFVFTPDDPNAALAHMDRLGAAHKGWINFNPGVLEEDVPVPKGGLGPIFGIGSGHLTSTTPGLPNSQGTQSFLGVGVLHEWSFGHVLGGHLGAGPALEYDAIWSTPFERHGLIASARLVFYGGP